MTRNFSKDVVFNMLNIYIPQYDFHREQNTSTIELSLPKFVSEDDKRESSI